MQVDDLRVHETMREGSCLESDASTISIVHFSNRIHTLMKIICNVCKKLVTDRTGKASAHTIITKIL